VGRPEKPIDPDAGPAAGFALRLRTARAAAGNPPYREMAARVHYSAPALSTAASARKFPSWELTRAYLRACGITDSVVLAEWRDRWAETRAAAGLAGNATNALPPAADGDRTPAVDPIRTLEWPAVKTARRRVPLRVTQTKPPTFRSSAINELVLSNTMADYVRALDQLRQERRLSIREISDRSRAAGPLPLARSTIGDVLNGKRRNLNPDFVFAYLRACGLDPDQIETWTRTYHEIDDTQRRVTAALTALTAAAPPTLAQLTPAAESPVHYRGRRRVHRVPRVRRVIVAVVLILSTAAAMHVMVTLVTGHR
jgi:transcriptional regulator with XRE-family HTH domain